jgi:hypothetical protein
MAQGYYGQNPYYGYGNMQGYYYGQPPVQQAYAGYHQQGRNYQNNRAPSGYDYNQYPGNNNANNNKASESTQDSSMSGQPNTIAPQAQQQQQPTYGYGIPTYGGANPAAQWNGYNQYPNIYGGAPQGGNRDNNRGGYRSNSSAHDNTNNQTTPYAGWTK